MAGIQSFEKLWVFYLGRLYDVEKKSPLNELLLYDSKDLVTYAGCNRCIWRHEHFSRFEAEAFRMLKGF
ncbi:MAG: hypothetical protein JTT13_04030 [Candidatus Brockarchaeota archaeon]|nr:hypothetical protein [Candidatus Brockarchaeota archaeon]